MDNTCGSGSERFGRKGRLGRAVQAPKLQSVAGGLAGLAASRLTAVPLVVQVARVGIVQLAAVAALASSGSDHGRLQNAAAHGGARTARTPATSCAKKTQPKKTAFSNRLNYHTFRMAMTGCNASGGSGWAAANATARSHGITSIDC